MSYAKVFSRACYGLQAPLVTVEVHLSNGLPAMAIVGLASAEVKESRERVRSALINSGFEFPARRITINLGPADLPKSGGRFDLAIAIGILAASGQIPDDRLTEVEWQAELSLSGKLKPVPAILTTALASRESCRTLVISTANQSEAALAGYPQLVCFDDLAEVSRALFKPEWHYTALNLPDSQPIEHPCLSAIKGNDHAKRALVLAVTGGHNLLFVGTPGSGKTMLAKAMSGLYPDLDMQACREVAAVESLSRSGFAENHWNQVRLRSPHHSASQVAITGGGKVPTPGEISLAHRGILFLDELPEFNRTVLESLRQPLEDGVLSISRAEWKVTFPARFQLVAAMNPCPCGYFGNQLPACRCASPKVQNYLQRISGPLLDRIDIQVAVNRPDDSILTLEPNSDWRSVYLKEKVTDLRRQQRRRQQCLNAQLQVADVLLLKPLSSEGRRVFEQGVKDQQLSMRVQQRVLRLALTIADWEGVDELSPAVIAEAMSYRALDVLQQQVNDWLCH